MADPVAYNPILIAGITASAVIIGGLISSGANYLIERQRIEREELKFEIELKTRDIERRDQAYIKFLSITMGQAYNRDESDNEFFDPDLIGESIALILTYGSPRVRAIVTKAYPFKSWDDLTHARRLILAELLIEKGGMDTFTGGAVGAE